MGQGAGDWTCTAPGHWLFDGTGMQAGDSIEGLIGWEFHGEPLLSLPGMQIVAEGPAFKDNGVQNGIYTATIYDGPHNNIVFNAATIWWANGLSSPPGHMNPSRHGVTQQGPDERVQQITHNLFQRMISPTLSVDNEIQDDMDFKLYPNPANGIINIATTEASEVEVFNVTGQTIYNNRETATSHNLDVSTWKSGVYFVKVHCSDKVYSKKLIVSEIK